MSVSRRAGPAAGRTGRVDPVLGRRQRRLALGRVVVDVGQLDRQLVVGHGHHPAAVAVDDRDRAAPVALAREQPVAQAVVDGELAQRLGLQLGHDRLLGLGCRQTVELAGVDQPLVVAVGDERLALRHLAVGRLDDLADLEPELGREVVVALVVGGHRHHRAGAVLHQHVVGDVHRDLLAGDGVGDRAAERHAGLLALGAALLGRLGQRVLDVVAHLLAAVEARDVRVLGSEHEEGGAVERVRAGGEDGVVDAQLLAAEDHLGALRAADPVLLHDLDVTRPVDRLEVVEQAVGVVGDAEEPLLELAQLDLGAAALAAPVDHLLVGEHGGVLGAPVDRRLLAVGEPPLVEAQEQPLRPAVVRRLVGAELARPVDRDAPVAELALELGDRGLGRLARVLAGADRVVLGRQAEGVVAERVQDAVAVAATEVRDRVADRVDLQVADVRLAGGVRQHLEHVRLRALVGVVGDLPRALLGPQGLPLGLDLGWVVALHCRGQEYSRAA